ncbi:MAG: tRNA pseudouridine(55) synthase TruB [Parachlamydiales bacterium]|nr:tRNA pseudouridine(55) synthase TruB [Parachlamydiales bacterium]
MNYEGILLVNKTKGKTSFSLIRQLRRLTAIKKIGHCGTLDPFARGVMVLLLGKQFTRLAPIFSSHTKEYHARLELGYVTKTFDTESPKVFYSSLEPSFQQVEKAISQFQGTITQIPPMYSAKKIQGVPLYRLARKGLEIPRDPIQITVEIQLITYQYPFLELQITCSKGTYVRSLANDLGQYLHCGAYLQELIRTRSGPFLLEECIDQEELLVPHCALQDHILHDAYYS